MEKCLYKTIRSGGCHRFHLPAQTSHKASSCPAYRCISVYQCGWFIGQLSWGGWLTAQIMTRPRTTLFFLHERNYLLGSTGTCPHGFLHVGGLFWECCNSRRGGIVRRSCRLEGPAPGHIYGPARHLPG